MNFYPKSYLKNILQVDENLLKNNNIKAILLDIDNTILNTDNVKITGLDDWISKMKFNGIKFCILSNTNKKKKAERLSKELGMPYIYFATKPLKRGFKKAQKIVDEKCENIAVIGDQIFTDIIGGNRVKMFTILVDPIDKKDFWHTAWKRPFENRIKRKIKNKK